jgi:hypothetical protein
MIKLFLTSHSLVSVIVVIAGFAIGLNPFYMALAISLYWAGREVAQAEHRFIHTFTPNKRREEMPVLAGYYDRRAWNTKSLWADMLIPFFLSFLAAFLLYFDVQMYIN